MSTNMGPFTNESPHEYEEAVRELAELAAREAERRGVPVSAEAARILSAPPGTIAAAQARRMASLTQSQTVGDTPNEHSENHDEAVHELAELAAREAERRGAPVSTEATQVLATRQSPTCTVVSGDSDERTATVTALPRRSDALATFHAPRGEGRQFGPASPQIRGCAPRCRSRVRAHRSRTHPGSSRDAKGRCEGGRGVPFTRRSR